MLKTQTILGCQWLAFTPGLSAFSFFKRTDCRGRALNFSPEEAVFVQVPSRFFSTPGGAARLPAGTLYF
jgi:hypothetical protein